MLGSRTVIEYVRATIPKPLVIVDSAIAFIEGNENESAVMRAFMRQNRRLAHLGAGVVIIHHNGKAESAKKYRGSSELKAALDVAYEIQGSGDPTRLKQLSLKAFKSRFATRPCITLRFDGRQFHSDECQRSSRTNADRLRDLLIANAGIKSAEFFLPALAARHGLGRDRARLFLVEGRNAGTIKSSEGPKNAQFLTWVGRAR